MSGKNIETEKKIEKKIEVEIHGARGTIKTTVGIPQHIRWNHTVLHNTME